MFLPVGLERLSIDFRSDTQSETIRYLLDEIPSRTPHLKCVEITSEDWKDYRNDDPELDFAFTRFTGKMH